MSLYNMLFGKNQHRDLILALIGLKECDVQRFRDCGIDTDKEEIWIYTRTGGGNRSDYPNEALTTSPYHKYNSDDNYDSTYATFYFSYPMEMKDDIERLLNMRERGISGQLIQWVERTLYREATENDKHQQARQEQMDLVKHLQSEGHLSEAFNGHSVIVLSDHGMRRILEVCEKNEGEFVAYWGCLPYKYRLIQNESKWSWDSTKPDIEQDKVRLGIDIIWQVDMDVWNRYKVKFGAKYPKSIAKFEENIQ